MEFEPGHLDADRVNDAGTPLLLRPIMWMLGGGDAGGANGQQMDVEQQQQPKEHAARIAAAATCSTNSPRISEIDEDDANNDENINNKGNLSPDHLNTDDTKSVLLSPPGVVRASDGDFDDDNSSSEEEDSPFLNSGGVPNTVAQMADLSLSESNTSATGRSLKRSNRFQHHHERLGKSSRTMSWSDERGNDLATYHCVSFFLFTAFVYFISYVSFIAAANISLQRWKGFVIVQIPTRPVGGIDRGLVLSPLVPASSWLCSWRENARKRAGLASFLDTILTSFE